MNRRISIVLALLPLQMAALSCAQSPRELAPSASPEASTGARDPFAAHALPPSARRWIAGHVEERVYAGNYVYLRLREPAAGDNWLVSLKATTPTTPDVRALVVGRAAHFHSRQLDRDFSPLLFAAVRPAAD